MKMGWSPFMVSIEGWCISNIDREVLRHPWVGGVVLFARNYLNPEQLCTLTREIREVSPQLKIAVDQEGGRIQRFREGFTPLPSMRMLGSLYDRKSPEQARQAAYIVGVTLASELRDCGIDFSFTPVLDCDFGLSSIIGNRAFHAEPKIVADLAAALYTGLQQQGMAAVAKHYPGHGAVRADSHTEIPVDSRCITEILQQDLHPFQHLISLGIEGVMPAHVIYASVDPRPAGFSEWWLRKLRQSLGFVGIIFSDDLSMTGASEVGGMAQRVHCAYEAGCDILLVCNNDEAVEQILDDTMLQQALYDLRMRRNRLVDWSCMDLKPIYKGHTRACMAQYQSFLQNMLGDVAP